MNTLLRNLVGATVLVGATTVITTQVVSQDPGQPDMEEMMAAWMKLGAPGPEHAKMAQAEGKWTQVVKHWMYPGAEPETSESIAEFRPILGGRYMIEKMTGSMEMMGEPMEFEGFGLFGYDNFTKKHFFVWADSMSTMLMAAEGTADASGNVITYYSEMPNPMTGETMKFKSVSTTISDDKQKFEMFEQTADGGWHRNMELVAKRSK